MREQIIIILAGGLVGLFPVLLATLTSWLEKRSRASKRNQALALAKEQVEFLDTWIKAQERLCSGDRFEEIKRNVSNELDQIKERLADLVAEEEEKPLVKVKERNIFQRLFLLYLPRSVLGWVFHTLFYMSVSVLLFLILVVFTNPPDSNLYIGAACIGGVVLMAILIFRYYAIKVERKSEEKIDMRLKSRQAKQTP